MNNSEIYAKHCGKKGTTVAKMLAKIAREGTAWQRVREGRTYPKVGSDVFSTAEYLAKGK